MQAVGDPVLAENANCGVAPQAEMGGAEPFEGMQQLPPVRAGFSLKSHFVKDSVRRLVAAEEGGVGRFRFHYAHSRGQKVARDFR
jgi:hypothetical protein